MRKYILIILLICMCIPVFADSTLYYVKNSTIRLPIRCVYQSGDCSGGAACTISIYNPNSSAYKINQPTVANGDSTFYYQIPNSNTMGKYIAKASCSDYWGSNSLSFDFEINKIGRAESNNIVMLVGIPLFFVLSMTILIFAFWMDGSNKISFGEGNTQLFEINYGGYVKILLFFMAYLSMWVTIWLTYIYSDMFILLDAVSKVFSFMFIAMTIAIFPMLVVCIAAALIKHIADSDLMKLSKRGLNPR